MAVTWPTSIKQGFKNKVCNKFVSKAKQVAYQICITAYSSNAVSDLNLNTDFKSRQNSDVHTLKRTIAYAGHNIFWSQTVYSKNLSSKFGMETPPNWFTLFWCPKKLRKCSSAINFTTVFPTCHLPTRRSSWGLKTAHTFTLVSWTKSLPRSCTLFRGCQRACKNTRRLLSLLRNAFMAWRIHI